MSESISPFEYTRKDIEFFDVNAGVGYEPFVIGRYYSYYRDTVQLANMINIYGLRDKRGHHLFLSNAIPKKQRRHRWIKSQFQELEALQKEHNLHHLNLNKVRELRDLKLL